MSMLIVRRQGGREAERIQQDMEEVFRSLIIGVRPLSRSHIGVWRPPVEGVESDSGLVVTVEIAGIREDDVRVVVDSSLLRISGVRRNPATQQRRTYHEMGIAYGPFEADVFLPFAIVLDGQVISAPTIREPILGGAGQISGSFTAQTGLRFTAEASADPAERASLDSFLGVIGPREGSRTIIRIGT